MKTSQPKLQSTVSLIGLDVTQSQRLTTNLQRLLADYSIMYQNVRGFHWNVTGPKFFELHQQFEELYNMLNDKIDEIAERIRVLSGKPNHQFSDYLQISDINEFDLVGSTAIDFIDNVVSSLSTLIKIQRELLKIAQSADDEGTSTLLSENISEQEKLVWMYTSLLGN